MQTKNQFFQAFLAMVCTFTLLFSEVSFADSDKLTIANLGAPIPVPTSDKNLLVYELQFTNSSDVARQIDRIEVRDENNHLLTAYSGDKLMRNQLHYKEGKPVKSESLDLSKG